LRGLVPYQIHINQLVVGVKLPQWRFHPYDQNFGYFFLRFSRLLQASQAGDKRPVDITEDDFDRVVGGSIIKQEVILKWRF